MSAPPPPPPPPPQKAFGDYTWTDFTGGFQTFAETAQRRIGEFKDSDSLKSATVQGQKRMEDLKNNMEERWRNRPQNIEVPSFGFDHIRKELGEGLHNSLLGAKKEAEDLWSDIKKVTENGLNSGDVVQDELPKMADPEKLFNRDLVDPVLPWTEEYLLNRFDIPLTVCTQDIGTVRSVLLLRMRGICMESRTLFLTSDENEDYSIFLKWNVGVAADVLKIDPHADILRYELVPAVIPEWKFWAHYFKSLEVVMNILETDLISNGLTAWEIETAIAASKEPQPTTTDLLAANKDVGQALTTTTQSELSKVDFEAEVDAELEAELLGHPCVREQLDDDELRELEDELNFSSP